MLNYPNMIWAKHFDARKRYCMSIIVGFYGLCVIVVQIEILNQSKCFHAMGYGL